MVSIPWSFAESVLSLIADILAKKAVPIEVIQKLAGKTGWAAGVAPVIWSQIAPLWAACADAAKVGVEAGLAGRGESAQRDPRRLESAESCHPWCGFRRCSRRRGRSW